MARSTALHNAGVRLLGVAFLLVPALLIALSVAIYNKRFSDPTMVTLRATTAGHEMHRQADVKVRGVVVGEVRGITASGSGATLKLAIDPAKRKWIPADAQARLLPTTVFGARYVSLVAPPVSAGVPIEDGSVITEDRSRNAIELSEVLNNTMRLLNAIKPAKLSATLNAMAEALEGRGGQLGDNLVQLNAFLTKLNPEIPDLARNLDELAKFTQNFSDAAPDLLQAFNDFSTTTRTVVDQRTNLSALYRTLTWGAGEIDEWVRENDDNLIALAVESRSSLALGRRYAPGAPCTFRQLADFIPLMNKVTGAGTDQPGMHVEIHTVQHKGRYIPGRDAPRYGAGGGPRCYAVPFDPAGAPATKAAPRGAKVPGAVADGGLGPANSASENEVVTQLTAPGLDEVPQGLPGWSSVLVGPVYRGAEVKIK